MKARLSQAWLLAVMLAAMVVLAGVAAAKTSIKYDFEKELYPWAGATDKGSAGFSFERATGDNGCMDVKGNSYARLKLPSDSGSAAWMLSAHRVGAPGNQEIRINASGRDAGNCATCVPLVYAGAAKPLSGDSFKVLKPAQGDGPVATGWTRYSFEGNAYTNDTMYVALGWKFGPTPVSTAIDFASALRNDYLYDQISPERSVVASAFGYDCVSLDIFPAP